MKNDFSGRFEIIYKKYCEQLIPMGSIPSETGLARYTGVSKTTVQRWRGGQVPGPESLKVIHDKLGFSYDWLISGEGEMFDSAEERIAELEAENRRLTTRFFMEGNRDEKSFGNTDRAAGQE